MRIAVTGATGELGHFVIKELLARVSAGSVIALARSAEKAADFADQGVDVRSFDYDRPEMLAEALAGVDRLLLISSSERGKRVAQHDAVIEAAKAAGVGLIVYTSTLKADTSPLQLAGEHRETEALIKASGVPYVILRNNWYTENYTAQIPNALKIGMVLGAAKDGRISSAARADYGAAAAAVLAAETPPVGSAIELAGDTSYTLAEFTDELNRQTGKEIKYADMPRAEYEKILTRVGLPDDLVALLGDSDEGASKGGMYHDGHELSALIGRPTTPLSQSIAQELAAVAPAH